MMLRTPILPIEWFADGLTIRSRRGEFATTLSFPFAAFGSFATFFRLFLID